MGIGTGLFPADNTAREITKRRLLEQHHTDIARLWQTLNQLKTPGAAFTDGGSFPLSSSSGASSASSASSGSSSGSPSLGACTWTWTGLTPHWTYSGGAGCLTGYTCGDPPNRVGAFLGEAVSSNCVQNFGQCTYEWNGSANSWTLVSTGCTGGHSCPGAPSYSYGPTDPAVVVVRNCT